MRHTHLHVQLVLRILLELTSKCYSNFVTLFRFLFRHKTYDKMEKTHARKSNQQEISDTTYILLLLISFN